MRTIPFLLAIAYCMVGRVSCFAAPVRQSPPSSLSSPRSVMAMSAQEIASESTVSQVVSTTFNMDESAKLLDDALRFNASAASELLSNINTMRANNATQEAMEDYINNLLTIIDNTSWWGIRPLRRFSRRARRASLGRVLELSMPVDETQDSVGNGKEADQQRRRRSLVVLLRALADENDLKEATSRGIPAIAQLEKVARREARAKVQIEDMANRMPEGLETPEYSVISSRSGYEIRNYKPFSVCSVAMNKPRPVDITKTDAKTNPQLAGASSFGALAGYLFGKNQQSTAMKMTTPVLKVGEGDATQMSFVLPSQYWHGLESAPKPFEESGVVLEKNEGGDRAVVMFGGFAGKKDVEERKKQLLDSLAKDDEWTAEPNAPVMLAQYNDPFTPPWKRRNEVSVNVVPKATLVS